MTQPKEPKWLTDDIKELFDYEVIKRGRFTITKLRNKRGVNANKSS